MVGEEPEPKFHVPYKTPADRSEKKVNRPCEKSRPSSGHPGHSSMIWACAVFPFTVIVIIWKQYWPPPYCCELSATMKSLGTLV